MITTIFTALAEGGAVLIALALLSVFASTLVLVKLLQLPTQRLGTDAQVDAWFAGQAVEEQKKLARIRLLDDLRALCASFELAETLREGERRARQVLSQQQSYLRPLEVIVTVAPLLGLLGTVLGMIDAFKAMEAAGSQVDPSVLSGGIWKALSTTAAGLGVAIPASLAHSAFERRTETAAERLRDDLDRFHNQAASSKT